MNSNRIKGNGAQDQQHALNNSEAAKQVLGELAGIMGQLFVRLAPGQTVIMDVVIPQSVIVPGQPSKQQGKLIVTRPLRTLSGSIQLQ